MPGYWSAWKAFPDSQRRGLIEAPIGPGVYEVRNVETGEQVAFGYAAKVAHELSRLRPDPAKPSWMRKLLRKVADHAPQELEYRTCAAATTRDAKSIARSLRGRRQVVFQRMAWPAARANGFGAVATR